MSRLSDSAYSIMLQKLKVSFIVAAFIGLMIFMFSGARVFNSYLIGFLLGSINFLLLSIELNVLINKRPGRTAVIHFIFFVLRYALIFYFVYRAIIVKKSGLLSVFGGLITVYLSIVIYEFFKNRLHRKEG